MAWLFCVWDHQTLWLRFNRRSTFHLVGGVFVVACLRSRKGPSEGVVGSCCAVVEAVKVCLCFLCRDERKHWACWDVLPRSHFFWGRNYLVTRSWVADPWSDRVAQRRRLNWKVNWKRLIQISNSERWCGPFWRCFSGCKFLHSLYYRPLCMLPQSHHLSKSLLLYYKAVISSVTSSLVFQTSYFNHHC